MNSLIARAVVIACVVSGNTQAGSLDNALQNHPVPYLALHANDPIDWQQWNDATVQRARQANKILFLSIGYFACHWCHVMQKESFQNEAIAQVLNRHFISVKIDRELEPALDQRLMAFAERTTGRAGWPLNVFVTPDGYPIHSVLYAPPKSFLETIKKLHRLWEQDSIGIRELVKSDAKQDFKAGDPNLDHGEIQTLLDKSVPGVMEDADMLAGGFGEQSKFPSAPQLLYLLDSYHRKPNETVADFLRTTLDAMQTQGLRDHLAGGFFRYTIDPDWSTPHFEKMLYDNAQLARLYLRAAALFDAQEYRATAIDTLDFMAQRMLHTDGAMVASLSAVDENGVEGGNYLWNLEQLRELLEPADLTMAIQLWGLDSPGTLDAGAHLRYRMSLAKYAGQTNTPLSESRERLKRIRQTLLRARDKRRLPIDEKLIAGWNGLALTAFAEAADRDGLQRYEPIARGIRDFLVRRHWKNGQLRRAIAGGGTYGRASLQDYAYVAQGLLAWARLTRQPDDMKLAQSVAEQGWRRFYRNNAWVTDSDGLLAPAPSASLVPDGPTPAPSASLIATTLSLPHARNSWARKDQARAALSIGQHAVAQAPFWFVGQLQALSIAISPNSVRRTTTHRE